MKAEQLEWVRFNAYSVLYMQQTFWGKKNTCQCFPCHAQVVANVHITYLGASENTDQIGKNTLDIYKDESHQSIQAFQQFSVVSMVLSILYMEHLFSLKKIRPLLFCFPVILNMQRSFCRCEKAVRKPRTVLIYFLSITVYSA